MGPIGSAKSTACVFEILARSHMQKRGPSGKRCTRWAVIRNTYPELKSTTIKTWNEWCPASFGKMNMSSPITHHVITEEIDMEVLFLALDNPDDVSKLLSLELTGAFINEARQIDQEVVDMLTGRVMRYPSQADGGQTWTGIIMDTNPCDDEHWWYGMAEKGNIPRGWEFFRQPSAMSPGAENRQNLHPQYYEILSAGKTEDWIKVYVHGEYGYIQEGASVYPNYRDSVYANFGKLDPIPGLPLLIGMDFGLTPAAIIGQRTVSGQWRILDEVCAMDCGTIRFGEILTRFVEKKYRDYEVHGWGDPSSTFRSVNTPNERTAMEILKANTPSHWEWKPAPGKNDFGVRREAVLNCLNRMIDGEPGLLISANCTMIRAGFSGKYHFRKTKTSSDTIIGDKPIKNKHSHPHDALQYLVLGGGEFHIVMGKPGRRNKGRRRIADGADEEMFSYKRTSAVGVARAERCMADAIANQKRNRTALR